MTGLLLAGYALAAFFTFGSTVVVLAKGDSTGPVRVGITLTNTLIIFMLVYGAVHA